jgi:hypothetical protein
MATLYGWAGRFSGILTGVCLVLAVLATPASAWADAYTDCDNACYAAYPFGHPSGSQEAYDALIACETDCGKEYGGGELPTSCPNPTDDPCPNYTNSTDCFLGTCAAANGACPCLWEVYQYYCYCP